MSKHTPGPWEVGELVVGQYELPTSYFIYSPDLFSSESSEIIVTRIKNDVSAKPLTAEDSANAHLIAAAPELYEALEAVERVSDLWLPKEWESQHEGEAQALCLMRDKILAALAKARGDQ